MDKTEYEALKSAFHQAYMDYMNEPGIVEAAEAKLNDLVLLLEQYREEHPECLTEDETLLNEGKEMDKTEYEEVSDAYQQFYQEYSKMMRRTIPEPWQVEVSVSNLNWLALLMKQYEAEHPEVVKVYPKEEPSEELKALMAMSADDQDMNDLV